VFGDSRLFQRILLASFLFVLASLASAQAPSAPGKPLPPGPMQAKTKAACTQCHATDRITEQRLTRQQWSEELGKMENLGAVIPDSDRNALLNYLTKNFGPGKGGGKTAVKKSGSAAN
jgi:competence protein ComEA